MSSKKVESGGKTYTITESRGKLVVTLGSFDWGDEIARVNTEKEAFNAIKAHSGSDRISIS